MAEARAGKGQGAKRAPGGASGEGNGQGPEPKPPICSVAFCPICTMVTAMGEARPDLVEHLLLAGREMLLAARAVIDARLESMDGDQEATKIQRITIE
jgi:hypothetical protein